MVAVAIATPLDLELRGNPISPGVASGRARVVSSPSCARVEPGDVLVIPSLHAGWVPFLLAAGGVVTGVADLLSDPAIVARELSIPIVAGIADTC
jgi:pyruvate,water dikinase